MSDRSENALGDGVSAGAGIVAGLTAAGMTGEGFTAEDFRAGLTGEALVKTGFGGNGGRGGNGGAGNADIAPSVPCSA